MKTPRTKTIRILYFTAASLVFCAGLFVWIVRPSLIPSKEVWLSGGTPEKRAARPPRQMETSSTQILSERVPPQYPEAGVSDPPTSASLEMLAQSQPAKAIAIALSQNDPAVRAAFLQAALKGWAKRAPRAAAQWVLAHSDLERGQFMSAVFNGAVSNADAAVTLATQLSGQDPKSARDYGMYLVFSLGQAGELERAASFASQVEGEQRTDLVTMAYTNWARQHPEIALKAALQLGEIATQRAAVEAALGGWAQYDPEALSKAAINFQESAYRKLALTDGLRNWIAADPAAAADWIAKQKFTPEMEAALED